MIIREPGKFRLFLNEKERLDIIKQITPLVNVEMDITLIVYAMVSEVSHNLNITIYSVP